MWSQGHGSAEQNVMNSTSCLFLRVNATVAGEHRCNIVSKKISEFFGEATMNVTPSIKRNNICEATFVKINGSYRCEYHSAIASVVHSLSSSIFTSTNNQYQTEQVRSGIMYIWNHIIQLCLRLHLSVCPRLCHWYFPPQSPAFPVSPGVRHLAVPV